MNLTMQIIIFVVAIIIITIFVFVSDTRDGSEF